MYIFEYHFCILVKLLMPDTRDVLGQSHRSNILKQQSPDLYTSKCTSYIMNLSLSFLVVYNTVVHCTSYTIFDLDIENMDNNTKI